MSKSERMQALVAQGWTSMFIVFLANIVMDLVRIFISGTQAQWLDHMGMPGVRFVLVVMAVYAIVPVVVRAVSARWLRSAVLGLTALMTLFVGAHEVSHLMTGDKPFGPLHALDLAHHLLGIATVCAGIAWIRQPD